MGGGYPLLVFCTYKTREKPRLRGKRFFLLILFFLFSLANISAAEILWSWENKDENITCYRYKTDVDDEWTEVDSTTTSVSLDASKTTFYLQSSYDGINWSESKVARYYSPDEPHKRVIIESLEFKEGDDYGDNLLEPSIRVEEHDVDSDHLSYTWNTEDYNWLRFRINDEPWYLVDTHTTGALLRLIDINKENAAFQIKGSIDGKKWTERLTINDKDNKYNEAYMNREGWMISTGFGVYYPYLVAFFTPAKRTINYTTPRELTTDDLKVSFGGDISASYETEKGNSFGFNVRYIYSPTHKNDPYTSMSLEAAYSRLIVRTKKYNTFQLWLNTGLGLSFCLFQKTGAIGLSCTLGFEARFTFSNNLVLTVSYGNTVIIEPNVNDKDQLTLGTTFYTTLPVRVGISYSFKEVKD